MYLAFQMRPSLYSEQTTGKTVFTWGLQNTVWNPEEQTQKLTDSENVIKFSCGF